MRYIAIVLIICSFSSFGQIYQDSDNSKLEILLGSSVTTNQLSFTVSYSDRLSTTYLRGKIYAGKTNNTTPVNILPVFASGVDYRLIDEINVRNEDVVSADVTLRTKINNVYVGYILVTLDVGDMLQYSNGIGWKVFTKTGQLKTGSGGGSGTVTSIATNTGSGITGGTITSTGTLAIDTSVVSTKNYVNAKFAQTGSGTVTSVATDATLTGGTITTSGTLKVDTTVVSTKANVTGLLLAKANQSALNDSVTTLRNIRKQDTSYFALNATRDSLVYTKVINGTLYRTPVRDSTGGGGAALSGLTAATATNTINNTNNKQRWQWNIIGADTAFVLESVSTTASSSLQNVFTVKLSGANATSGQTTKAGVFSNTHTGSTSTNVALELTASGANTNTALNITAGDIQLVSNGWINFLSNTQRIGSLVGVLQYHAGSSQHFMISTNTTPLTIAGSTAGGYFSVSRVATGSYSLIFNGDYAGGNYRGELTYSNVIKTANGILDICANTGQAGSFGSFTPNVIASFKPTGVLNIKPITATAASAITPAEGDIVFVSTTNATFTSIGIWGYQNGAWIKI